MNTISIHLDEVDYQILRILQENAKTNNADIARCLNMAPSAILERVKKLENKQVIKGYYAQLNAGILSKGLLAFIFVKSHDIIGQQAVGQQLANLKEVLEVHDIAGDDGYLIKVRTRDTSSLVDLMRHSFSKIEGIISTKTTIVLETIKESTTIALTPNE